METKRYIITFEQGIELEDVARILGTDRESIKLPDYRHEGRNEEYEVTYLPNFGIAIVKLSSQKALEIAGMQGVIAVETDIEVSIPEPEPETDDSEESDLSTNSNILWNMRMIGADDAWMSGLTGRGVNVAILDTGVADHPALRITGGRSFIEGEPPTNYGDKNGHGTHCAGIASARPGMNGNNLIVGVAPRCNLYALKVFSDSGGKMSHILKGLDWCCDNNIQVASISLGGKDDPRADFSKAIALCQSKGTTIVCATGNSYDDKSFDDKYFPWVNAPANSAASADLPHESSPVAVGSVDSQRNIANSSSRGVNGSPWNPVTVAAPGVGILSAGRDKNYVNKSGTSMACPHVAGFAALLYEKNPEITPMEVHKLIRQYTIKRTDTEAFGHGIINIAKMLD